MSPFKTPRLNESILNIDLKGLSMCLDQDIVHKDILPIAK